MPSKRFQGSHGGSPPKQAPHLLQGPTYVLRDAPAERSMGFAAKTDLDQYMVFKMTLLCAKIAPILNQGTRIFIQIRRSVPTFSCARTLASISTSARGSGNARSLIDVGPPKQRARYAVRSHIAPPMKPRISCSETLFDESTVVWQWMLVRII